MKDDVFLLHACCLQVKDDVDKEMLRMMKDMDKYQALVEKRANEVRIYDVIIPLASLLIRTCVVCIVFKLGLRF